MKGNYIFYLLRAVMDQRDPGISPEAREKLQALTMQDMELLAGCRCRIFSISLCSPRPLHTNHASEAFQTGQAKARCADNGCSIGKCRNEGMAVWKDSLRASR